jgi:two-component system response regulator CpxR
MSGLELLRRLRKTSDIPVLMLTARGEALDRILGLEMGADDYLPKPFNPRELVARIDAIGRRSVKQNQWEDHPRRLEMDDLMVDFGTRTVYQHNKNIKVTAVEFTLLAELLRHAGQVMSREELTLKVLGRELDSYDRSIDVHVSSLRRKLGHQIDGRERIKSIRSVGYIYTEMQGENP